MAAVDPKRKWQLSGEYVPSFFPQALWGQKSQVAEGLFPDHRNGWDLKVVTIGLPSNY